MNTDTAHQDVWRECPAGELRRLAGNLRRRDVHRTTRRAALSATVLVVAAVGVFSLFSPTGSSRRGVNVGGLWCNEAVALVSEYHRRKLAPEVLAQLTLHLDSCPHCHKMRDQIDAPSAPAGQINKPARH